MKIIDRKSLKSSTNDSAVRKEPFGGSSHGYPLTGGSAKALRGASAPAPRRKP